MTKMGSIQPRKINGWNPKHGDLVQMMFLFNWIIFRFHVHFQRCFICSEFLFKQVLGGLPPVFIYELHHHVFFEQLHTSTLKRQKHFGANGGLVDLKSFYFQILWFVCTCNTVSCFINYSPEIIRDIQFIYTTTSHTKLKKPGRKLQQTSQTKTWQNAIQQMWPCYTAINHDWSTYTPLTCAPPGLIKGWLTIGFP